MRILVYVKRQNSTVYVSIVTIQLVCLFVDRMKALDLVTMKILDSKVNIIPVIAKADTITKTELQKFKSKVSFSIPVVFSILNLLFNFISVFYVFWNEIDELSLKKLCIKCFHLCILMKCCRLWMSWLAMVSTSISVLLMMRQRLKLTKQWMWVYRLLLFLLVETIMKMLPNIASHFLSFIILKTFLWIHEIHKLLILLLVILLRLKTLLGIVGKKWWYGLFIG